MSEPTAVVLNIQRMSTEDGPGIRTTVFFKGCSLACDWCHNPESLSGEPQVQWFASRCLGCRLCLPSCPNSAIAFTDQGVAIDRTRCTGCGACARECPSTALELLGETWTLSALVNEVAKDAAYFEQSDGGVTVSGGEPTMQAEFVAAFLAAMRERGLHTALDTCGQCSPKALAAILPHTDLVLFDMKLIDAAAHKRHTGVGNRKILQNLLFVRDYMSKHKTPSTLWIRTPIIPDATASFANLRGIGAWLAEHLGKRLDRWDLCAFNNLCRDQYVRLGLAWPYADQEPFTRAMMDKLAQAARESGVDGAVVHWSGTTKIEDEQETPLRVIKNAAC